MSHTFSLKPCDCTLLMLKPCVGVMWLISSDASCFRRVVLPALSKPRRSILTSWSGALFNLRKIESKPLNNHKGDRLLWKHSTDFDITGYQNNFSLKKVLGYRELMLLFFTLIPLIPFASSFQVLVEVL